MTQKAETAPANADAAPKAAPRFEVKLLKDHRHGGNDVKAGATIKVTARQREFLAEQEIIGKESK